MTIPAYCCSCCNGLGLLFFPEEGLLSVCRTCHGAGSSKVTAIPYKCPPCEGKGKSNLNKCIMTENELILNRTIDQKPKNCRVCSGSGVIWSMT